MATSSSCSYGVILQDRRTFVIVNLRVSDKHADKIVLCQLEESKLRTTVHDYDRRIIKSILFDDGHNYTSLWMYFTMNNGSVDSHTVRIFDRFDNPLDGEVLRSKLMPIARFIMWYETLPAIIGKKKSNGGLCKEEDEKGEICSICHDEYQANQMIGTLNCKHNYHEGCIKNWLSRKKLLASGSTAIQNQSTNSLVDV
ncbi:zinc finger, RING/FYVE/PHD-type [Artemisia annua]|uniref:RING-type E3 ubiquitin transferase n=1 Tax=Artemisia annua TaxID=35608 RepID=A0A2U1QNH5_ARTAN|nr:zinc finger, RING/FYVE/PHD-type [Artemisia annua]